MSKSKKEKETKSKEKEKEAEAVEKQESAFLLRRARVASQKDDEAAPTPLWLVTFTDVMALMLTFFVLLYSMAVPKEEDWKEMTSAFEKGFSKFKSAKNFSGPQDTINIDKLDLSSALNLNYLEAILKEVMDGDEKLANVVIIPQDDRLVLSLPSELLFEVGKAEVSVQGKRALFALGGQLSRIRNRVEVIGHADPDPISTKDSAFNSNWELSLMRAATVAGVLENVGYARPITIRGLSSGRYEELVSDISEDERLSLSRRVDIVIMKDDGSQRGFMRGGSSG